MKRGFWRARRVLVTGHTGFKGAWLALMLESLGAELHGLALAPATTPNLFDLAAPQMSSLIGDLRDPAVARNAIAEADPEIVFHLAAQALVRPGYTDPLATFETNVMGTANLLEALRAAPSLKAVLVVTSDKVYANHGGGAAFGEDDALGGNDPYSASKACQDLVAAAYGKSFFGERGVRLARARAGNVIGGGDWSTDRLVPDFIRAVTAGEALALRYPDAVRPWQHVLEPLAGYLAYGEHLAGDGDVPEALNFGPEAADARSVGWVADYLTATWGGDASWRRDGGEHPEEAAYLSLDASRAAAVLGIAPRLSLEESLTSTIAWYRAWSEGDDMRAYSLAEIGRYGR